MHELIMPFAVGWLEMVIATAATVAMAKDKTAAAAVYTALSTYLWAYIITQFNNDFSNRIPEVTAYAAGGAAGVVTVMKAREVHTAMINLHHKNRPPFK